MSKLFHKNNTHGSKNFSSQPTPASSLETWIKRLEQSHASLSGRLAALEKRVSNPNDPTILEDTKLFEELFSTTQQLKQDLDTLEQQQKEALHHLHDLNEQLQQQKDHFQWRIKLLEYRQPPYLRIMHLRIPLEIIGIIGGLLFLGIGILLYSGNTALLTSPWIPLCIGILLLTLSTLKTLMLYDLGKTNDIPQQQEQEKIKH